MTHWMFRCDAVSRRVSQGMDAPLSPGTRLLITMHLWMCRHCRRFNRQMQRLRKIVQYDGEQEILDDGPPDLPASLYPEALSPEARDRIKSKLHGCR